MEKVYLFGAHTNCISAIDFLGSENIEAVIDNDLKKQGTVWRGLEIISLNEYVRRNDKKKIFITAFRRSGEIVGGLREQGIQNYQICPYMMAGYFASADEVINKLDLKKEKQIAFYDRNPIAEKIADTLSAQNTAVEITYFSKEEMKDLPADTRILLTIKESEEEKELLENKYGASAILDVGKIYMEQYRFRNPKLRQFKNIHKGKRCFIVGNGPSLRMEDLNMLHERKEICFAGNSIYLAYENTNWRPDYYVTVDRAFMELYHEKINELDSIRFVMHYDDQEYNWIGDNIYEFGKLPNDQGVDITLFSYDIEEGTHGGYSLVYDAIQIALYMGFAEIYLLGVDASSGGKIEEHHFYGGRDKKQNAMAGTPDKVPMRKAIGAAGEAVAKVGGLLKNATRGGELEEIGRVDFDSLF